MRLIEVDPLSLTPLPFNPESRTYDYSLADLLDSMSRVGILSPVMITEDGTIVDGHRRVACAKILKMATIPAITTTLEAGRAYVEANTPQKPLNGRQRLAIKVLGGPIVGKFIKRYTWLESFLSKEDFVLLNEKSTSVESLVTEIRATIRYLGMQKTPENLRKICMWLSLTHGQQASRRARRYKISPEIFLQYIEKNQRLPY